MKIHGIFRGFPGLGRVVSGVELLESMRINFDAEIRAFSYLQGEAYLIQRGYIKQYEVKHSDYSTMGIIPVSNYGEWILRNIERDSPDLIIIDGEPLMIQAIKLCFPSIYVLSLLNPFDVNNPFNERSSQQYFNHLYSLSDEVIVHGLVKAANPGNYKEFSSINTILRKEVLQIVRKSIKNKISFILGGGTVNTDNTFIEGTVSIVKKATLVADSFKGFEIHIYCSSELIFRKVNESIEYRNNIIIHLEISDPATYFFDSKLIISRGGRNTVSELLYLGIPSIVIATGCGFRINEQKSNIEEVDKISNNMFYMTTSEIDDSEFIKTCDFLINRIEGDVISKWNSGNIEAFKILERLFKNNLVY